MNNVDEYELLDILLGKYKAIVVDNSDRNRIFLDKMCHSGYLVKYDYIDGKNYYHVKEKFKNKVLSVLKSK